MLKPDIQHKPISFVEFVCIIAALMAVSALSIDNVLPAFGPIARSFGITSANEIQLVLYSYMIAMASMQIVYGPLADRYGRRPAVLGGLVIYFIGSLAATFAPTFELLLAARVLQGVGAAATRVVSLAIVRDRYAGREMARVMSFTMMIFIMVPMIAPAIGSAFLQVGTWKTIFASMLVSSLIVIVWFNARMPETLHPEFRRSISLPVIFAGFKQTVTTRVAFGYATAQGLLFSCVMGYVGQADQIFESEVYKLGALFPVVFALVVIGQGIAAFVNSRLVRKLGTRRISHSAILGFIAISTLLLVVALAFGGIPPLWLFTPMLTLGFFLFGLAVPNFNAMAMEPMGAIAGTASSFIGFYTTLLGAVCGLVIGQSFDGTVVPLITGFIIMGVISLAVVLWTEHGQLFTPRHPAPVPVTPDA